MPKATAKTNSYRHLRVDTIAAYVQLIIYSITVIVLSVCHSVCLLHSISQSLTEN